MKSVPTPPPPVRGLRGRSPKGAHEIALLTYLVSGTNVVDSLKWDSGGDTGRFIIATVVSLGVALGIWFVHKKLYGRPGGRPKVRVESLQVSGLSAEEAQLLNELNRGAGGGDPARLVRARAAFEKAVQKNVDLLQSDGGNREQVLESLRHKLGWDHTEPGHPMTTSQQLELNLEAELFGTGAQRGFCVHGVLAHRDARHLVFRLVDLDDEVPWGAGDEIEVYFWRENDAGYLFRTEVIDVRGVGAYVVMRHPDAMERKQRRLYVRVGVSDSVRFLHIPAGEVPRRMGLSVDGAGGLCEGLIEDLSAGGFRLRCHAPLSERDYVSIAAFEPIGGEEILARVVNDLGCDENGVHCYGLQYAGLPASARERITQQVFKLQRRALAVPAGAGDGQRPMISFTDLGETGPNS